MGRGRSGIGGGEIIQNAISFDNMNAANEFFGNKWRESMTQEENIALYNYTDDGYRDINSYLRTGQNGSSDITANIKDIDSAIEKFVLREPIVVTRGCNGAMFGLSGDRSPTAAELQAFVGQSFVDKGFVSTSAGGHAFWDYVTLKITVPSGRGRGVYIGVDSAHPAESEFLLRRGARYHVTGVEPNGTVLIQML